MLWGVLGLVAALVVLDLVVRVVALISILPILERSPPFSVEAVPPAPDAEPIAFRTPDGLTLRGHLSFPASGPPLGLVIFCPEVGGDHWSADWYAHGLLRNGFAVLGFDFRNQGQSDRLPGYEPLHWLTEYEVTDALAAIEYARRRPDLSSLPWGMLGISRGGSAALVAAARTPEVRCVAAEGAFSISTLSLHYAMRWATLYHPPWLMRLFPVWHFRSSLALARWVSQWRRHCRYTILESWLPRLAGRPVLMIVDGRDAYVLPEISETLFERFPLSSRQRWVVSTAKHNQARQVDEVEFDRRLVEFFSSMTDSRSAPSSTSDATVRATGRHPLNGSVSS